MAYTSWSVTFGEQPSAAKWNILGTNDASFNDGTGFTSGALGSVNSSLANGIACQVKYVNYSSLATGTTTIPVDDTIPQNTEGTEFMTLAITPKSSTNILVIDVVLFGSNDSADRWNVATLFQDSTANALAVGMAYQPAATAPDSILLRHTMVAGTTSSTTFKVRAGSNNTGTFSFNGSNEARFFGAAVKSSIVITEYKAT